MKKIFILLFSAFLFSGCDSNSSKNSSIDGKNSPQVITTQSSKSSFSPFYVYLDRGSKENHYVPSGFMPNGQCVSLQDSWAQHCHTGSTCIKVVYDIDCSKQSQHWVGVYWLNPANNWGQKKGGFNLVGAQKLTFWARGEKGGERLEEVTIGGLSGDYPDSDSASIGPVILSKEWKQYSINLIGRDLSYISGGFAWAASADNNPYSCIFYLDNIRFE